MIARVLVIAGSDSGGGAGLQADVKTITMMGGHAMTAITAITAQNTQGVSGVSLVDPAMVLAQIDAVHEDLGIDAVKIGMIGSARTALQVADRLKTMGVGRSGVPLVFDPVMVATSGARLADAETVEAFQALAEEATLTTPNLPEAEAMGGIERLNQLAPAVLLKGGHGPGDRITDRLYRRGVAPCEWRAQRIDTRSTHGTGCTLASAIACRLGQGADLIQAVQDARLFVRLALWNAPGLGQGAGPMGHGAVRLDVGPGPCFNQVTIGHRDYEAGCAFYRALGLRQIVDAPPRYARFESPGGATLSLQQGAPTGVALYFEWSDVDQAVARLAAHGMEFETPPEDQAFLWREAWTRDPAGNRVCFYQAGENRRYPPWRIGG